MPRRTSGQKRVELKPVAAHKNIDGGRFPGSHKAYAHTMCLSNKDTPWGKVPAAPLHRVTELSKTSRTRSRDQLLCGYLDELWFFSLSI